MSTIQAPAPTAQAVEIQYLKSSAPPIAPHVTGTTRRQAEDSVGPYFSRQKANSAQCTSERFRREASTSDSSRTLPNIIIKKFHRAEACCCYPKLVPWGQEQEQEYKSKLKSHAGSRELTHGVLQHVCRKTLMIGYSHNSPGNQRWLVKTLWFFRPISPVLPPSQVVSVKDSAKRSAAAISLLKVVMNPEKIPDHAVRTTTDPRTYQSLAREAPSEVHHWSNTACSCSCPLGTQLGDCSTDQSLQRHTTDIVAQSNAPVSSTLVNPKATSEKAIMSRHRGTRVVQSRTAGSLDELASQTFALRVSASAIRATLQKPRVTVLHEVQSRSRPHFPRLLFFRVPNNIRSDSVMSTGHYSHLFCFVTFEKLAERSSACW